MSELPEAPALTDAQRVQLQELLHESSETAGILGSLISDAEKNLTKVIVATAQHAVLFTCNQATEATWSWCGDGDAPTTLGTPQITCPHVDGSVDLDDFADVHGVGYPLSASLLGDMYEEDTFLAGSRSGRTPLVATHSRTNGRVFTLDLTKTIGDADERPNQ